MVTGTAAARIGDGVVVVLIGDDMVAVVVGDSGVIRVTGAAPGMAVVPIELIAAIGLAGAVAFVDVTLITEGDSSTIMGAQFTLVPGIVGFCASGGEARLVAGAPGTVAAEKRLVNGPGPVSGDDTIAPGVVGTPMAVVPMVETCARQLLTLSSSTLVV